MICNPFWGDGDGDGGGPDCHLSCASPCLTFCLRSFLQRFLFSFAVSSFAAYTISLFHPTPFLSSALHRHMHKLLSQLFYVACTCKRRWLHASCCAYIHLFNQKTSRTFSTPPIHRTNGVYALTEIIHEMCKFLNDSVDRMYP